MGRQTDLAMKLLLLFLMIAVSGCADGAEKGPRLVAKTAGDIDYGTDICAWSGKVIETVRYGAVLQTQDGSRLTFNSAESMARYMIDRSATIANAIPWVVDFASGDRLVAATDAVYLLSPNRPSPGGLRLTPIERGNLKMQEFVRRAYPGRFIEWADVMAMAREVP